jgi:hypothetical protein
MDLTKLKNVGDAPLRVALEHRGACFMKVGKEVEFVEAVPICLQRYTPSSGKWVDWVATFDVCYADFLGNISFDHPVSDIVLTIAGTSFKIPGSYKKNWSIRLFDRELFPYLPVYSTPCTIQAKCQEGTLCYIERYEVAHIVNRDVIPFLKLEVTILSEPPVKATCYRGTVTFEKKQ